MHQNIYQNSTRQYHTKLYMGKYYDFMLHRGNTLFPQNPDSLATTEFCCPFSFFGNGKIKSTKIWNKAVNDGVEMNNIGLTGIDNGFIQYDKTRISNSEFLDIFTKSKYIIPSSDFSFFMSPISGNTGRFDFPMSYVENDDECYLSFKGGFYQGFYALEGTDYKVLPNTFESDRILHFDIRPRTDYEIKDNTINALHPENKGIFFYMGLRAENKMMAFYNEGKDELNRFTKDPNHKDAPNPNNKPYLSDELNQKEYFGDGYNTKMVCPDTINPDDNPDEKPSDCGCQKGTSSINDFYSDTTTWISNCCDCKKDEKPDACEGYFKDDYFTNPDMVKDDQIKMDDIIDKNQDITKDKPLDEYSYNIGSCDADMPITTECKCKESQAGKQGLSVNDFYSNLISSDSHCKSCDCDEGCECKTVGCSKYYGDEYMKNSECGNGNKSIDEEYMKPDTILDESKLKGTISDSNNHILSKKGYYEVVTDNKFLMFDRTPDGVTVDTYKEGMKVALVNRNDWGNINLFEMMNRTPTGYTVDTIDEFCESNKKAYDLFKDIRNNAFALRITGNGAVGYRYGIKDCDADDAYKIIEEYTKDGIIKNDEWNSINVRFVSLTPKSSKCDESYGRKMRIMIYVNGFLKLVSKALDMFDFHGLDDSKEKQEGVPYSMSLGGGTLGLLEMITPDYYKVSNYMFPLERDFCGSFIGDIKCFRIYEGFADYSSILNYLS